MLLADVKNEIKAIVRRNTDRGHMPSGGCMRVCAAMTTELERSMELEDRRETFAIHIYMLVEVVKLIGYADSSSGAPTDVIRDCLQGLETICRSAPADSYEALMAKEEEWSRLLVSLQASSYGIEHYGKALARIYPEETYAI